MILPISTQQGGSPEHLRPAPPATHESPSLSAAEGSAAAYELKFRLTEPQAREVEARLRDHLAPDPHADPTLGGYRVTSVYFDTPRFDVYHRADGYRVHKFRVRRYGADPVVFLERKSKRNGRVWKRRTAIPLSETAALSGGADDGWTGVWFARQLADRSLRPVCRVAYQRTAFVGLGSCGPIRLTMDRAARGMPVTEPAAEPFAGGVSLLDGGVIVEFKFLTAIPALFKDVIEAFRLSPSRVSKYRRCADAAGLVTGEAACA